MRKAQDPKGYAVALQAGENPMSAETWSADSIAMVSEVWWAACMQCLEGHNGEFKPYAPFNRKPVELFEECSGRR